MWLYQTVPTGGAGDYWAEVGITIGPIRSQSAQLLQRLPISSGLTRDPTAAITNTTSVRRRPESRSTPKYTPQPQIPGTSRSAATRMTRKTTSLGLPITSRRARSRPT
jgi:hypothetical protein